MIETERSGVIIRILQVLPYLQSAGTEKHVLTLTKALLDRGHEVQLLAPEGPLSTEFAKLDVEHIIFSGFSGNPRNAVAGIADGVRRSIDWGVDVIHVHAGIELLFGVRRALKRHRPIKRPGIVFTVHSYFGKRPAFDYCLAAKMGSRWADRLIAVSHADGATLSRWMGRRSDRLRVVHNGMPDQPSYPAEEIANFRAELRRQFGAAPETPICLVVGRLTAQKGIDILIEALSMYRGPHTLILIAGDGDLRESLEEQAKQRGLVPGTQGHLAGFDAIDSRGNQPGGCARVAFLGAREDVPKLLAAADLMILPSRMEGLSLALVEAHAAGVAVLATDVGGNREIVSHEETGYIIPPEKPQILATVLADMLSDTQRLEDFGKAARARFKAHFTVDRMTDETVAVYDAVVSQ